MDFNGEDQVRQWFIDFEEATKRGDREALGRMIADDYRMINPDGSTANKEGMLNLLTSPNIRFDEFERTIHTVRVEGGRAEALSSFSMRGTYGGRVVNGDFWDAKTFVQREGGWQMTSHQIRRIEDSVSVH